jgi:hypothetical protein
MGLEVHLQLPVSQETGYLVPQGILLTLHIWSKADVLCHLHGIAHQIPQ